MTAENFSIEVDSKFVENLFGLADMPAPKEIELEELHNVILKIREKLNNAVLSSSNIMPVQQDSSENVNQAPAVLKENTVIFRPKSVLVVDDLGIITYQLDILFRKMGFNVTISQEINDAIEKYKKQDFGYVVMDFFIPTEREGLILLDEIKKLALLCKLNTRIIVMTASSKAEYHTKCINRGAHFFIEKSPGWQKKITEAMQ